MSEHSRQSRAGVSLRVSFQDTVSSRAPPHPQPSPPAVEVGTPQTAEAQGGAWWGIRTVMDKAVTVKGLGTYRADVFFKSTGATMEAEPWTDRQETLRPRVSS